MQNVCMVERIIDQDFLDFWSGAEGFRERVRRLDMTGANRR